jgi:hypothetical protein
MDQASAAINVMWARGLLNEMNIERTMPGKNSTVIYANNQGAIKLANNSIFQKRTKRLTQTFERYLSKSRKSSTLTSENFLSRVFESSTCELCRSISVFSRLLVDVVIATLKFIMSRLVTRVADNVKQILRRTSLFLIRINNDSCH